jgi:3-methyladenine DNA glycosylase AlkD
MAVKSNKRPGPKSVVRARKVARKPARAKKPAVRAQRATRDERSLADQVADALAALEKASTQRDRDNMARFGIDAPKFFGVSMANLQKLAQRCGPNHELAEALWKTGWYEARMLATLVDEPERVTAAQMERWCRDFDNWGICDTACFKLFDRVPHAWNKAQQWCERRPEFEKRAGLALIACLALHDKKAADEPFAASLALIERCADDERNFIKKSVSWALRAIGTRNAKLRAAALEVAWRLGASTNAGARWAGKDAARALAKKR